MYYAAAEQLTTARNIVRLARRKIKDITGMNVTLMLYPEGDARLKTPEQMLRVIAIALDMSPDCYRMKTRMRNIVELRFIAALILRMNYPRFTLQQVAALFGGQDHSSIINGLERAHNLIYTGDPRFTVKYNKALNAVNVWLKGE